MIYKFGAYQIDTELFEIRRRDTIVPVEPQVFDLIKLLIESRGRIVSKDEILGTIWKGRAVSDAAISSCIKAARRTIGDSGKAQSYIKTIHRRGVCFVGEGVVEVESANGSAAQPPTSRGRASAGEASASRRAPAASSSGPGVETTLRVPQAGLLEERASGVDLSLPSQPSIVVLPFAMLGAEEADQVLSDGLSLDIMTGLARTRSLFVISRGTAFMFRGVSQDARSISAKLGVRYVLQGSIQLSGKRIRVHAALTDAIAGSETWADHFNCDVDDILEVRDRIARDIIGAVESEIEQSERRRALLSPVASLSAWSAYHRGTWHMYQFTPAAYEEAERLFKLAAKLDPSAARVFAGLSFVHWQRAFLEIGKDREGEIEQAFEYAQQALILDPREPQGYWALGRAFLLRQEIDQAVEEIGRSVSLNPSFAIGHYSVSFARMLNADSAGSDVDVRQARRLSPYDLMSFAMLTVQAVNATLLGRVQEGADLADRAVRQPNSHYHILAMAAFCNAAAGRDDVSRSYVARLKSIQPSYRIADYFRAFPYRNDDLVRRLRETFRRLGLPD